MNCQIILVVAVELYDGILYLDLGHAAVFLPHACVIAMALVPGGASRRCSRFRVAGPRWPGADLG
jgi:hypothetical protein